MSNFDRDNPNFFAQAERFQPAVWLGDRFSAEHQQQLIWSFFSLFILAGLIWVGGSATAIIELPAWIITTASVIALIALLTLLTIVSIRGFYLYYRLNTPDNRGNVDGRKPISYPAADLLLHINRADDLLAGFLSSRFGRRIITRSGVDISEIESAIGSVNSANVKEDLVEAFNDYDYLTLTRLAESAFTTESGLQEALLSLGITEEVFCKAALWVEHTDRQARKSIRFWSWENLSSIKPIGQYFAYGEAYTLEDFSTHLSSDAVFLGARDTDTAFRKDIQASFNILSRPRNANLLLVGPKSGGVGDILKTVRSRLRTGDVPDQLTDRKMYVLDTQSLIAVAESGGSLKGLLQELLAEAANAGNVLLVIENIVRFRHEVDRLDSDLFPLLDTFLESPQLPIIATSTPESYHQHLEGGEVMSRFGAVMIHDIDDEPLFLLLSEIAVAEEGQAFCTVRGLEAIGRGGRELITDDEMPHAAVGLLLEILSVYPDSVIDQELVEKYLSEKTGVRTGAVDEGERNLLRNLEDRLHERIIGQEPAVTAIASSLRRTRAGVENPDRPIGSFLFVGPTGVGKTETAKTLDQVYFENSRMLRLDMSEYNQSGAVENLRGRSGESGRLANIVREQLYGVLLLDEFEKANPAVHDLFLQILDEGYFTDGAGRKVNLDNMIIIATSNAAARTIFSLVENGADLHDRKKDIIDELISSGEFRPELLNRFDDTILFHPLSESELHAITRLLLDELCERMQKKGYRLQIADPVVSHLVEDGYDPEFGARAIRRVIQNQVENAIADKIINKELSAGDEIILTVDDLKVGQSK